MLTSRLYLAALISTALGGVALAQDVEVSPANNSFGKAEYSPYLDQGFPDRVYFGDTHLHTSYSTDAGMVGNRLGPEEAYRFARGEEVISSTGLRARLQRPLDFLVVSDHAENLGLAPMIEESNPDLLRTEFGRLVHGLVKSGKGPEAYEAWIGRMNALDDPMKGNEAVTRTMWERETEIAEKYNQPGKFSAIIGYEWTSMPDGNNLHRNVIFRDGKAKADEVIPFSQYDSVDPEDLWTWMADYEKKTGGRVLAIPHGGNLSLGLMFDDVTLTTKKPIDKEYAERRMRWEPLYEVTQMKGDGEAHAALSPNDEFTGFETWDRGSFGAGVHTADMLPREYAREALKRGLKYEQDIGVNPFKFGMVGSTDAHTSLATTTEDNFFGKVVPLEPSAGYDRFFEVVAGRLSGEDPRRKSFAWQTSASGLAAVWATDNTREALWDAMSRKEVYATTGTRLMVRVFAGYDFEENDVQRHDFAAYGYRNGVPMGGDLAAAPEGKVPSLMIRALRDADGANLDRIQVVKGWLDAKGDLQEKVYDVAWSGDRKTGADGKLPAVGNTVDAKDASYTNTIGAPLLTGYWKDPDFDPKERAFYYVRAIEIPTPRWTTYDAKFFKTTPPPEAPVSIQDRAYTSPIWYTP
ncbi:MAG: DUF3604 domain-containing protein [Hyphomicrobiales bacterium]|nr:DUF3604 domain-containing protein [Hyphomicrobiales bacterium]